MEFKLYHSNIVLCCFNTYERVKTMHDVLLMPGADIGSGRVCSKLFTVLPEVVTAISIMGFVLGFNMSDYSHSLLLCALVWHFISPVPCMLSSP